MGSLHHSDKFSKGCYSIRYDEQVLYRKCDL